MLAPLAITKLCLNGNNSTNQRLCICATWVHVHDVWRQYHTWKRNFLVFETSVTWNGMSGSLGCKPTYNIVWYKQEHEGDTSRPFRKLWYHARVTNWPTIQLTNGSTYRLTWWYGDSIPKMLKWHEIIFVLYSPSILLLPPAAHGAAEQASHIIFWLVFPLGSQFAILGRWSLKISAFLDLPFLSYQR